MPKTRLTVADREEISALIIDHRFAEPIRAAEKEQKDRALEAYRIHYAKHAGWMAAAPEGALPTVTALWFSESADSPGTRIVLDMPLKVFASTRRSEIPMTPSLRAAISADRNLTKERIEAQRMVGGLLASFRTFEDAIARWPEAETFIQKVFDTKRGPVANLPAVVPDAINRLLDLPPHD